MLRKIFICLLFTSLVSFCFGQKQKLQSVIFDSDMGPDYDDVGAITLLHAFADSGYVKILATVSSTSYEGVAGIFSIFNTYFHRPDLPIGIPRKNGLNIRDWQHWTDTLLAKYPHAIKSNEEVPDATDLYRKILAKQPDHSVIIISVGFFTNLSSLLQTKPDQYSPLTGAQLVQKKVKQLVSMAGWFPSGKEFNVQKDAASSQYVFTHWTTPILLSGFDIGKKIRTGLPLIQNAEIKNSPVQDVFRICIPMAKEDSAGRMSWDETAVLVAVKGYAPFYTLKKGKMMVNSDGSDFWNDTGKGQSYLVEKISPAVVQQYINKVIQHQPLKNIKKKIMPWLNTQ
jgi:inosine-uridine nucleoside N-ribohydrolase